MPGFDPYRQWLGMRAADARHPRRLLRLAQRRPTPEEVEQAALRVVRAVQPHAAGEHAETAARILEEIADAHAKLLDAARRHARMQSSLPRPVEPSPAGPATPPTPPATTPPVPRPPVPRPPTRMPPTRTVPTAPATTPAPVTEMPATMSAAVPASGSSTAETLAVGLVLGLALAAAAGGMLYAALRPPGTGAAPQQASSVPVATDEVRPAAAAGELADAQADIGADDAAAPPAEDPPEPTVFDVRVHPAAAQVRLADSLGAVLSSGGTGRHVVTVADFAGVRDDAPVGLLVEAPLHVGQEVALQPGKASGRVTVHLKPTVRDLTLKDSGGDRFRAWLDGVEIAAGGKRFDLADLPHTGRLFAVKDGCVPIDRELRIEEDAQIPYEIGVTEVLRFEAGNHFLVGDPAGESAVTALAFGLWDTGGRRPLLTGHADGVLRRWSVGPDAAERACYRRAAAVEGPIDVIQRWNDRLVLGGPGGLFVHPDGSGPPRRLDVPVGPRGLVRCEFTAAGLLGVNRLERPAAADAVAAFWLPAAGLADAGERQALLDERIRAIGGSRATQADRDQAKQAENALRAEDAAAVQVRTLSAGELAADDSVGRVDQVAAGSPVRVRFEIVRGGRRDALVWRPQRGTTETDFPDDAYPELRAGAFRTRLALTRTDRHDAREVKTNLAGGGPAAALLGSGTSGKSRLFHDRPLAYAFPFAGPKVVLGFERGPAAVWDPSAADDALQAVPASVAPHAPQRLQQADWDALDGVWAVVGDDRVLVHRLDGDTPPWEFRFRRVRPPVP